jgi:hypothetical protein
MKLLLHVLELRYCVLVTTIYNWANIDACLLSQLGNNPVRVRQEC